MAKGNIFLGFGRGKLGDIVLTRNAGEQVTRPRNRHPRNPQTPAQMFQRGSLATVSEMYIRGTRNFFKYAFMNKTAAQSEYNKFCQLNIGRVPCNSKTALSQGAPAIGNFIMTEGSLQQIRIEKADTAFLIRMRNNVAPGAFSAWTIGDVSRAFIETFGYQVGDIITYLDISCPAVPYQTIRDMISGEALTSIAGSPLWDIKQFRLDTTSTELASTLGIFGNDSSDNVLELKTTYAMGEQYVEGITIVCSRNVKSNVLVSTSELLCNTATQVSIDLGMSNDWKEAVARYWVSQTGENIAPVNILQGSLSVPVHVEPVPEVNHITSIEPSLPSTATSLTLTLDYTLGSYTSEEVGDVIGYGVVDGTQMSIEVTSSGSSISLECGSLTMDWSRGQNTISVNNSGGKVVSNMVITKNINN